jgi:hypothetical protein
VRVIEPKWVGVAEPFELFAGDKQARVHDARTFLELLPAYYVNTDRRAFEREGDAPIGARHIAQQRRVI